MIEFLPDNDGLVFCVKENESYFSFDKWKDTDDCIYYFPLANLIDNGFAFLNSKGCKVPYENVYLIDEDDRSILGIPPFYDKESRLIADGMLNANDFKYKFEMLTHVPDGELIRFERAGCIIYWKRKKYLLPEALFELVKKVDAFNETDCSLKCPDYNFRKFAEIKSLAFKANCHLDSYLENENVVCPDTIKVEVEKDENGYSVKPALEIPESTKFTNTFERMRTTPSIYPLSRDNGERVRVVLSPEQKEGLSQLKQSGTRNKTRDEIKMLTDSPTEFFDPNIFDLTELYSDRVIEIGIYKPKFYPFVSPYKSCWVAGANIETPENGTSRVTIENEEQLDELKRSIAEAEDNQNDIVNYNNVDIHVDDAKFLASTAERQLRSPNHPVDAEDKNGKKVLIIEENAEEVGYSVENTQISRAEKYKLFKNPYLSEGFELKQHQEEGVAWLQHLYLNHAHGCLMADDMGLGKTLQILYFIDWHSRNFPNHKPYIIVAPVSLLENWEIEYKRFFAEPRLKITRLTSKDVPRKYDKNIVDAIQKQDIILTNYESLRISQLNFCAVEFDIVALDEAQKIKTPGTLVTNAAKALKSNFKIAMTGTPVENSLLDLWCIMDFCVPGLLGNAKSFAAKYQTRLSKEGTDLVALGNEIHESLGIYFLRRLKADVAKDLPEKIEVKQPVKMPHEQEVIYKHVVNEYNMGHQPNMLVTIMNIREVSEHPYLYNNTLHEHNIEELVDTSARLIATSAFLDRIREKNEKVILFAERKETQKVLQRLCYERYGIVSKIINGDTPSIIKSRYCNKQSRQSSIDEFQAVKGFNVIIMSPVAAGMGLNVTAANHVIHYGRHWNPAKENQATDRAYRIGQTKDVFVYYPMAVSEEFKSFDETLNDLLSRKSQLASSTIYPTEKMEITKEELYESMFK